MWSLPFAVALSIAPASAQPMGPNYVCPQKYELWQFQKYLDAVDEQYLSLEFRKARMLLEAGQPNMPCIVQVVPTDKVAAYAIRRAYGLALDLDENEAERWALLAFALDPDIDWPSYIPPDHAARAMLEDAAPSDKVRIEHKGLAAPEGGGVFLDGRFLQEPVAEAGLPHLLQIGDGTGQIVFSTWQDGASFPDAFLGPEPEELPLLPAWYGEDGKIKRTARPWTERRLGRLESAAGFAIASGTLYATAALARSAYQDRPTNGLFYTIDGSIVASGAAGATSLALLGAALFGK